MGTDIYLHIEYREEGYPEYRWFACPELDQSSLLFALLAGVKRDGIWQLRGDQTVPLFPPRGIPDDIAHRTRRQVGISPEFSDAWESWDEEHDVWEPSPYWHTPSWLSINELRAVKEQYGVVFGADAPGQPITAGLAATLAAMERLPNARAVFWFDS